MRHLFISNPSSAFAAGFFGSVAGSGMQMANIQGGGMVVGSTLVGGISAEITGGDFWQGALQAGIIAAFNHAWEHMDGGGKYPQRQCAPPKEEMQFITDITLPNGQVVKVVFGKTNDGVSANRKVHKTLKAAFEGAIIDASETININEVTIKATTNGGHSKKSKHYSGRAIDISAINGVPVRAGQYVTLELQSSFERQINRRENFGPNNLVLKFGKRFPDSEDIYQNRSVAKLKYKHRDHIHWSVD